MPSNSLNSESHQKQPLELIQMTAHQWAQLPRKQTVFFFPVGPLEDHGPHLTLGLDLAEATQLCQITARHLEAAMPGWVGIVMPAAPLGVESNTTHIALTVRPHVLRDWLVDACSALIREGFFHFVCFSGHSGPKQLTAIEDAGALIRRSTQWGRWKNRLFQHDSVAPSLVSANSALVPFQTVHASPFWPDPVEHGGKRDTSVALAISNSLVHPDYKSLPERNRKGSRWQRNLLRRQCRLAHYWGRPGEADAKIGEQEFKKALVVLFPKMQVVWAGGSPRHQFKSWYSILPLNKSFFKAWLLFFLICFFTGSWLFLNLFSVE